MPLTTEQIQERCQAEIVGAGEGVPWTLDLVTFGLLSVMVQGNHKVRMSNAMLLGKQLPGDRRVIPCLLLVTMRDPDEQIRRIAYVSLGEAVGSGEAVTTLTDRLPIETPKAQIDIVRTLAKIITRAVPPTIRVRAVETIASIAGRRITEPAVRAEATTAFQALRAQFPDLPPEIEIEFGPIEIIEEKPGLFAQISTSDKVFFGVGAASIIGLGAFLLVDWARRRASYRRGGDVC